MPALSFTHFFGAAVMKTDLRHSIYNIFPIQLQNDPQHTMCTGVLRSDIQEHKISIFTLLFACPILRV